MTQISLYSLEFANIFLRALAVGELLVLCVLLPGRPLAIRRVLLLGTGLSVIAYLLLTAPIPDADYGMLRNILLVLTDAFVYWFWFLALFAFDDEFRPGAWPTGIKLSLGAYAVWFVYVLGVREGQGISHDIIHGIALLLIAHVIFVAVKGFRDDLVDSRRRLRIISMIAIGSYTLFLVVLEFMDERIRNDMVLSLMNSAVICLAILVLARLLLRLESGDFLTDSAGHMSGQSESVVMQTAEIPEEFAELKRRLDEFVAGKQYCQSNLSISMLARQLDCPEHHLRRLINRVLGFRNFNAFLNDLRIRDAVDHLADPQWRAKPILTIALELGYGSIGPFNRAFRQAMGQTPSEYRRSVQNRR